MDNNAIQALRFRCIGPPRGGRVIAVAGHPTEDAIFYFGACAGGVWKTEDAGTYWENISDGYFKTSAVGALAVSASDPNVLYAGMGETATRLDISYGDGVYRSADEGKTWTHVGLEQTHHIGKIRIHPKDSNLVYVAAFGHVFGPNAERGVYRSHNGGGDWNQVLFKSDKAGAVDLSMDPKNPRILYASIWEAHRNFWNMSSGGVDSGIHKTCDGGDTWEDLSERPGMPVGIKGKIGIAVSPARNNRVWAIIEAEKSGLYRSDDGGETWALISAYRDLIHRPFYYCHIYADPQDADTVYILNLKMWKSNDGGATFSEITTPHGDNHDLWIDPCNPRRMAQGNDGGACISFNGGNSWSTIYNQLTSQFYRIDVDNRYPYRVMATQQDNSSISVPSATEFAGITWQHCYPVGTGESGDIVVHPNDPNIVYIGSIGSSPGGNGALQRYDHRTRQIRLVNVWPEEAFGRDTGEMKYRFNWTFPISFSPHDENVLYAAGNRLFRSLDEGSSWEPISPDLTKADPETLIASGGPITKDATGAEHYGTIYAFAESPLRQGELWTGSDDGLVHISSNDGETWVEITPPGLEPYALIAGIDLSRHKAGTAYVAITRYKEDDYQPYLYKTSDFGETWVSIGHEFPSSEITRVIREDPKQPGLLYVGTETGIVYSPDDGASWFPLRTNFPVVPVYDLKIVNDDLIVGTHGRSFWILDDLTPLRVLAKNDNQDVSVLYPPRPTIRHMLHWSVMMARSEEENNKNYMMGLGANSGYYIRTDDDGAIQRTYLDAGENPPHGVIVYYTLGDESGTAIKITIKDDNGDSVQTFVSRTGDVSDIDGDDEVLFAPAQTGLNRFVWDMRCEDAEKISEDSPERTKTDALLKSKRSSSGPLVPPGRYLVQLTVGEDVYEQRFEILKDPRVTATQGDLEKQFKLWSAIRDRVEQANRAVDRIRRIQRQLQEWERKAREQGAVDTIATMAKNLRAQYTDIECKLVQIGDESPGDTIRLPRKLIAQFGALASVVAIADEAPPQQAHDRYDELSGQLDEIIGCLDAMVEKEVTVFNQLIGNSGLFSVVG